MVCAELAWPFRGMTDKMPGGARCSQPFWYWFAGVRFTHGLVGIFARTCGCGFFTRIFWCRFWMRILGCGFFADLGCDFFRGFCDGLCGFGVRIFFCGFFWLFPAEQTLKKSHPKIPPKNPRETFLHNTPPHSFWQDTADLLRQSGCRCTLWTTVFSAQMASVREDERVVSMCI